MSSFPASPEAPDGMKTIQSEADGTVLAYLADIVYERYESTEVKLHLITPGLSITPTGLEPRGSAIPLVVYVPGSAWFPQNLERSVPRMVDFAMRTGYAVAVVAYRPSTVAKSPAQLIDIKSSIRFLRANAATYNIDPERLAIWGTSSGGHMASLVGVTEGMQPFISDFEPEVRTDVRAVIDFFGPTDFLRMADFPSVLQHDAPDSPESVVIGGPIQDPELRAKVDEYNPITYISDEKDIPPFLIMHGDRDPLVPFNQSVLLFEALKSADQDVEFYKIEGAGHGTRFFTPEVLDTVARFLERGFQ